MPVKIGSIRGPKGDKGESGPPGGQFPGGPGLPPVLLDALRAAHSPSVANPYATLADTGGGGGGGGPTVLTANVAFDTAGLNNANDLGADIGVVIPAGSMFLVVPMLTTSWNQPGVLTIAVGTNGAGDSGAAVSVAGFNGSGSRAASTGGLNAEADLPAVFGAQNVNRWAVTPTNAAAVFVAFYPDGNDPTAGAATIKVIVIAL